MGENEIELGQGISSLLESFIDCIRTAADEVEIELLKKLYRRIANVIEQVGDKLITSTY